MVRAKNWSPGDIEQVYVSVGPGSFTGLRIGVTIAKTTALASSEKIVAVPTVKVLAKMHQLTQSVSFHRSRCQTRADFYGEVHKNGRLDRSRARPCGFAERNARTLAGLCICLGREFHFTANIFPTIYM